MHPTILRAPISSNPVLVLHQERFHSNIAKAPNGGRVVAFKGDPLKSLAGLVAKGMTSSFDAVYIDASHEVSWENQHHTNKESYLSQYDPAVCHYTKWCVNIVTLLNGGQYEPHSRCRCRFEVCETRRG